MDYGKTLNLPETEFPMRAGLPQREPDFLKFWEENDIYGKSRLCMQATRNLFCMTALRMQTAKSTWVMP